MKYIVFPYVYVYNCYVCVDMHRMWLHVWLKLSVVCDYGVWYTSSDPPLFWHRLWRNWTFCLFLWVFNNLFSAGPKDVKDIYYVLKDNAAQLTDGADTISYQVHTSPVHDVEDFEACFLPCIWNLKYLIFGKWLFSLLQITFSLLFSLITTFVSDAISALSDKSSMISQDASFRTEFQDIVRRVDTFL